MAALCGAVWLDGRRATPGDLAGVSAALAPFGPAHTWEGDAGPSRVAVTVRGFGSGPDNPAATAVSAGGEVVAFVDGHLHRRQGLAARLGEGGPASDAELVVAAYQRWGRSFPAALSGPYAAVVVDRRGEGVMLARDHAGDRFLAVHERDGVVAFASTALALTGFPGVGHEVDVDRVIEALILAHGSSRTFVRGVRSVGAGWAEWVGHTGRRSWRWWPTHPMRAATEGSMAEHAGRLRGALEEAVESALGGASAAGVLLSGGLDSTSVAAVAARQLAPEVLRSYTSVPPAGWSGATPTGWIPSDQEAVEALARRLPNLAPRFLDVEPGTIFDLGEPLWELGSPPVRNPLNLVWVCAAYDQAAADGVDVILSGSGGNLAFSADGPMWLRDLARRGRFLEIWREATAFSRSFGGDPLKVLRKDLLANLLPGVKKRRSARGGGDPLTTWLSTCAMRPDRLAELDPAALLPELTDPNSGDQLRNTDWMFRSVSGLSELGAAVRARWGVEVRDPTTDRGVVEVALTQPEWLRRRRGEWRAVCRAAMRDVLPPEVVDRATLGAQQPEWIDRLTAARAEVAQELDALRAHPLSCELIDVPRLELMVRDWPERDRMAEDAVIRDYQLALPRALVLSRYLRWFEDRARRRPRATEPARPGVQ